VIAFHLDAHSGIAPYLQIVGQVRQALLLGLLKEGDKLPTVKEVVARVAINPNTVSKAYRELEHLSLAEEQTLAVSGGAGLLASYAISLAKLRGIRVLADANPEDEELGRSFGAGEVLPRGAGCPAAVRDLAPVGADGFLDTALLGQAAIPAICDGGRLAIVRGLEGIAPERGIEVREVYVFDVLERTDWLEELRDHASRGALMLRVAGEYPPERAGDAHRAMEAGGLRGRALIVF